jgi:predicted MFS family arabinose efflux permease
LAARQESNKNNKEMLMSTTAEVAHDGHLTGYGEPAYRNYVLFLLMVVYTLNFVDRTLIAVVAQPIIDSFGLTDSEWGLLYGPPFAIFYAVMGLPIALWADRSNRVKVITVCIILWSLMTALCGIAAGFAMLLFFRIGVAIGEAGCTPISLAVPLHRWKVLILALGFLASVLADCLLGLTGHQLKAGE